MVEGVANLKHFFYTWRWEKINIIHYVNIRSTNHLNMRSDSMEKKSQDPVYRYKVNTSVYFQVKCTYTNEILIGCWNECQNHVSNISAFPLQIHEFIQHNAIFDDASFVRIKKGQLHRACKKSKRLENMKYVRKKT